MFKLLKIAKKEDPRRPRSTRRRRRRIPGAAGGRSVIDHAASTQSVILNKKSMNTYMYDLRKYISIYHSNMSNQYNAQSKFQKGKYDYTHCTSTD